MEKWQKISVVLASVVAGTSILFSAVVVTIGISTNRNINGNQNKYAVAAADAAAESSEDINKPEDTTIDDSSADEKKLAQVAQEIESLGIETRKIEQKSKESPAAESVKEVQGDSSPAVREPDLKEVSEESKEMSSSDAEIIKQLEDVLKYYPDKPSLNFSLSMELFKTGSYDRGLAYLLKANGLDPSQVYGNYSTAVQVLRNAGYGENAKKLLEHAMENDRDNFAAYEIMQQQ